MPHETRTLYQGFSLVATSLAVGGGRFMGCCSIATEATPHEEVERITTEHLHATSDEAVEAALREARRIINGLTDDGRWKGSSASTA